MKKILCLLLCGALILPLAGCELTINGKQIFSTEPQEEHIEEETHTAETSDKVEKKTEKKETDAKLDYVCAQCGKQMYKSMLNSKHENDFCSVKCQDKWYTTQREMNEKKYNCLWCGAAMNEYQYNTWNGCCSEICAVNREGTAYENWERDQSGIAPSKDSNMYHGPVPDGGITICGWCGARVTGDGTFCSKACEKAHHDYYGVD